MPDYIKYGLYRCDKLIEDTIRNASVWDIEPSVLFKDTNYEPKDSALDLQKTGWFVYCLGEDIVDNETIFKLKVEHYRQNKILDTYFVKVTVVCEDGGALDGWIDFNIYTNDEYNRTLVGAFIRGDYHKYYDNPTLLINVVLTQGSDDVEMCKEYQESPENEKGIVVY